jgi:photosystem II stability/assembly factor-like uncharacterized protein
MRMTRTLLVVALLLLPLGVQAQAQDNSAGSLTPNAAGSQSKGADVLWHEKAPSWGGVVTDMKLLAPKVGWAERGRRLYWTTDNGADWRDITPPLAKNERLGKVFFLDSSTGWIVIDHPQDPWEKLEFALASTGDAGTTWSRTGISLPLKDYGLPVGANAGGGAHPIADGGINAIVFADRLHGWLSAGFHGQTMNLWFGLLLLTSDGGRTWNQAANAPELTNVQMLLINPSEGWLYGGEVLDVNHLYVTRDGARNWQEVAPNIPGSLYNEVRGLPVFEDVQHGFLEVIGPRREDENLISMLILFKTSDEGRTWKPDRTVSNLDDDAWGKYSSSTIVGSDWIFAAASDDVPVLTKVSAGASIDGSANADAARPKYKMIRQINFTSPTQGWVITSDGELRSTTDGGATWTNISSGPKPHVIHPLYGP